MNDKLGLVELKQKMLENVLEEMRLGIEDISPLNRKQFNTICEIVFEKTFNDALGVVVEKLKKDLKQYEKVEGKLNRSSRYEDRQKLPRINDIIDYQNELLVFFEGFLKEKTKKKEE